MSHDTLGHDAPDTSRGHETRDANLKGLAQFAVGLIVVTALAHWALVLFFNYLEAREAGEKQRRYPLSVASTQRPVPPPPRLQTYPFQDVKELRLSEEPLLTRYAWVDKNAGVVRIPVDRAMELLAERGLPARQPGQPSAPVPVLPEGAVK